MIIVHLATTIVVTRISSGSGVVMQEQGQIQYIIHRTKKPGQRAAYHRAFGPRRDVIIPTLSTPFIIFFFLSFLSPLTMLALLRMEGLEVGLAVGLRVGRRVGRGEGGRVVGCGVGLLVGFRVGSKVGLEVGTRVGAKDGDFVVGKGVDCSSVGAMVGEFVG